MKPGTTTISYPDLRSFLSDLRQMMPDKLLRIEEPVPLHYTSTALVKELDAKGESPVLLLQNVEGYQNQIVANLYSSREVIAQSVGKPPGSFYDYFGYCLDHLVSARQVDSGPVHEIVLEGDQADLSRLPIPIHFAEDAGPYITAGMTVARDPETGCGNLSFARLQVKGPRKCGVSLHSRQHLWDYFRRSELIGQDLPVCVVIGVHPAVMLAAAAKMGMDQDEYDLAGALLGQPLPVCRAKTVNVNVPVNAEIVIEGYLKANLREPEGPFGEYTGFSTDRSTQNVLEVTAITTRKAPIFVDLVPGNSREHLNLGRISKEAWVYKRMKEALPFFMDFSYPASGTHYHCMVRIRKTAEGQAQQAAMLLMGLDPYLKLAIVVDEDIDPADEQAVMWAVATSVQADRDVAVLSNVMCNQLDPSTTNGTGAKMIVDATRSLHSTARRISLPQDAIDLARSILERKR